VDVHHTIESGVLDKGMPAWSAVLKPDQVMAVAVYVLTLRDTHPPNPKEPQGVEVEDDAASDAAPPHDHRSHD
jgi:cytochrome c oxidase cbb3-type subunit 3